MKEESCFEVLSSRIIAETDNGRKTFQEASVRIKINGEAIIAVAEDICSISALHGAVKKALKASYPEVFSISLVNYNESRFNGKVRVVVTCKNGSGKWAVSEVSSSDAAARTQAVAKSFKYILKRKEVEKMVTICPFCNQEMEKDSESKCSGCGNVVRPEERQKKEKGKWKGIDMSDL